MTATTEETPANLERRVRRLEDAHTSMEKSITGLGTSLALAEQEQRHTRELMDSRFNGVETALTALSSKVDTLTSLMQTQSTDPNASVINREVERRLSNLEEKTGNHDKVLQQGVGASRVFKGVAMTLGSMGALLGLVNFLHTIGAIK